ncbi:unnamed protein product [Effrenium voratum]|nr:unnamed protein product [Effrenium voratum]
MEEEALDVGEDGSSQSQDRVSSLKDQFTSPNHLESLSSRRAGESREAVGTPSSRSSLSVVAQPVLKGESLLREDREGLQKMFSPSLARRGLSGKSGKSAEVLKFPGAASLTATPKEIEEADLLFVPDDDQEWQRPRRPPPADCSGPSKHLPFGQK